MKKIFTKKRFFTNLERGTTIVELLLYMGIFTIILGVLTTVFVQIIDAQLESQATSSVEQDGRYILAKIMYDLNQADSISVPALGVAPTNTMQLISGGVSYTYSINANNNLQESSSLGTNQLNSYDSSLTGISFRQIGKLNGKNTVQLKFTIASRTTRVSGKEIRTFQSTTGLR